MVASAEAQELEETLSGVEASVGDLVGPEDSGGMEGKTCDFGHSLMTQMMLDASRVRVTLKRGARRDIRR